MAGSRSRAEDGASRRGSPREADVREAQRAVEDGAVLLDVRSGAEYRAGHAPSAIWIPLASLPARMTEVPTDRAVCVICHSGGRSSVAVQALRAAGLADVVNVRGGMAAWIAAGLPVEPVDQRGGFLRSLLSGKAWPWFGR